MGKSDSKELLHHSNKQCLEGSEHTLIDSELQSCPNKLLEVPWDKFDCKELLSRPSKILEAVVVDKFDSK